MEGNTEMLRLNSSRIDHPFNKDAKDEKDMKREKEKEKKMLLLLPIALQNILRDPRVFVCLKDLSREIAFDCSSKKK